MPSQLQRREATQQKIIKTARKVFARDGYAKAALSEIVEGAGVTTGAIYHHYKDKKGLFIAVARYLEELIVAESAASASKSGSAWDRFETNIINTLVICARPDIQRIVFKDAPTVVGLHEWRKIELEYGFGQMRRAVASLADSGVIKTADPDLTAQILLGAMMEAAHYAAISKDKAKALKDGQQTFLVMLRSLRGTGNLGA